MNMGEKEDKENKDKKKKKIKKPGIGLALWCLAAVILLIIFLVEKDKITSNLKQTDFFHRVFGKTPTFIENHEVVPEKQTDKNDVAPISIDVLEPKQTAKKTEEKPVQTEPVEIKKPSVEKETEPVVQKVAAESETKKEENAAEKKSAEKETEKKKETTKPAEVKPVPQMNLKLFFIEIASDGTVNRREFIRAMKKSDSPLVDSINALINGPTADEMKSGNCRSFIPSGTRLLGALVKNGVATLNFSEEFEFNQYGVEGTLAQLQQVVYTATAFPTVDSVQIILDGERKEYLGSEGVWIGTPLNRSTFN